MLEDMALERNRRAAWAKYYAVRSQLSETEMRRAELAVFVEMLNPPAGHPVWEEVAAALEPIKARDLEYVRRYVNWRVSEGVPSAVVMEIASA